MPDAVAVDKGARSAPAILVSTDISQADTYLQVDTSLGSVAVRRTLLLARCRDVECGDMSRCLTCVTSSSSLRPVREPPSAEQKQRASEQRSRRMVADVVASSGLDHLATLTAGKGFRTRQDAADAYSGYLDDKQYGRWFADVVGHRYITVAEPFEDAHGWHLHIALSGRLQPAHLERLKSTWTGYLESRLGIPRPEGGKGRWRVHIQRPCRRWHNARALGRYLSKYITKESTPRLSGRERRYRAGLGLTRPLSRSRLVRDTPEGVLRLFRGFDRYYEIHDSEGRHIGWSAEKLGTDPDAMPPP